MTPRRISALVELPSRAALDFAGVVRYFPERLPIGIHPAGRGVLIYVITNAILHDFREFLQRHAALLGALPVWTLRIVVPPHLEVVERLVREAVESQLLTPLPDEVIDEMRWYFEQARAHASKCRNTDSDERFYPDRMAFAAPRFRVLYHLWRQEGDAILADVGSSALADAVAAGTGRIEVLSSGHRYVHLSSGCRRLTRIHDRSDGDRRTTDG